MLRTNENCKIVPGADLGGGHGGPMPPPSGLELARKPLRLKSLIDARALNGTTWSRIRKSSRAFAKMKRSKPLAGAASKRQCCGSADIRQYLLGSRYVTKFTTAALQLQVCRSITGIACISSILAAVLMHPDASLK